jgi:predicted dehydrogenase
MTQSIRWGIIGAGSIANAFATGLKALDDAELVGIGSRSQANADRFGDEYDIPHRHDSYEALVSDPDIDAIYIATPHPFHCENALLCLDHGKAVLCEKPFAINAAETRQMVESARAKKLFLMEAMWTRFLPVSTKVREIIAAGTIGDVRMMTADFCFRADFNPESRLFAPELGGGGLLDIGVYVTSYAHMVFGKAPSRVVSMADMGETGVDEQAGLVLGFDEGEMAMLTCATRTTTPHAAAIYGTDGMIEVTSPFWQANELKLTVGDKVDVMSLPFPGNGYTCEAEEVGRCLRAGKLESDILPLDKTIAIVETLDTVRAQWGLTYPSEK